MSPGTGKNIGDAEEGMHFLPPNGADKSLPLNPTFLPAESSSKSHQQNTNSSPRRKWCRCCTCKCCGLTCLAIFIVIGAIMLGLYLTFKAKMDAAKVGGASSENSDLWESTLSGAGTNNFTATGEYQLVSYSPTYREYLLAFGIPSFVIGFILEAKETMDIKALTDGRYALTTETAFSTNVIEFEIGKEFELPWGRNQGVMHSTCEKTGPNTWFFHSQELEKGWNVTSELKFFDFGIVNTRTFLNSNITCKKYYKRLGVDVALGGGGSSEGATGSPMFGADADVIVLNNDEEATEESPFADDSEDDLFANDNDDDDMFANDPFFDD